MNASSAPARQIIGKSPNHPNKNLHHSIAPSHLPPPPPPIFAILVSRYIEIQSVTIPCRFPVYAFTGNGRE